MNIYLDIDGVLLANENNFANFAHEFLAYVTSNYPTYWLTTHCRGDSIYTLEILKRTFPHETLKIAKKILSTNWKINKTEAFDFKEPFLWFDDDLLEEEKNELNQHHVLENWIEVDLRKDANHLQKFLISFPIPIELIKPK